MNFVSFRSVLESLVRAGRTPEEAIMTLVRATERWFFDSAGFINSYEQVPEAYASQPRMSEVVRSFYRYHEAVQEAWDGPALLVFSGLLVA